METQHKLALLFVDDDPCILALLPFMLSDMTDEWHMEFAQDGTEALKLMAQMAFDAVASDLHMPGMDGIELLRQVRDRYPSSARILCSSDPDRNTILESASLMHQFLPKPWPRELLKATVRHAIMIRSFLPNADIRDRVSKMERIPSMPAVYLKLIRQLQSPHTTINEVAETVSSDMEMTAHVLRTVNSAFFGLPEPTSNIAQAISFLGIETVKHLVLAVGIFSQFESDMLAGISIDALWKHSLRTAEVANIIAKSEFASRQIVEDATAAGLLHDVGKLVLATNYPNEYKGLAARAQKAEVEWLVAERQTFGFDHAEVGGYLLGLWGLPPHVVEAVAFHHFPSTAETSGFSALTAVHAANVLVHSETTLDPAIILPHLDLLHLAKTGRTDGPKFWREELSDVDA